MAVDLTVLGCRQKAESGLKVYSLTPNAQRLSPNAFLPYGVTRGFPKQELFGMTSQIRRAAMSVASNIVAFCARNDILGFRP